jgi:hypothetical protein
MIKYLFLLLTCDIIGKINFFNYDNSNYFYLSWGRLIYKIQKKNDGTSFFNTTYKL